MDKREKLLNTLIALAPFNGWSDAALRQAAKEVFSDEKQSLILFPEGISAAVDLFADQLDAKMVDHCDTPRFHTLKIREKVTEALMFRFSEHQKHSEAIRKLLHYYTLPQHTAQSMRNLWETADRIWYLAGDTATDYNYYTKRTMLAGVYSSTLLAWLTDPTEDMRITREFLDRRIQNVMQIEKAKADLRNSAVGRWLGQLAS